MNRGILTINKDTIVKDINQLIEYNKTIKVFEENQISDGYHTFADLYEIRKAYNVALFNLCAETWYLNKKDPSALVHWPPIYNVHKSWKHNDGSWCFNKEKQWFIVSAMLPTGLISNHYKAKDWELFKIPEVEKAIYKFDGHNTKDVINRLLSA